MRSYRTGHTDIPVTMKATWLQRYILPLIIAGVGVGMATVAFRLLRAAETDELQDQFAVTAGERVAAIGREIDASMHSVESVASYFAASERVERDEFATFVAPILARQSQIRALQWVPRVPAARRSDYEEAARTTGFPDFRIIEPTTDGAFNKAGDRAEYYPVYYVEPYDGNERVLGLDLASEPARNRALRRACDTGTLAATAPIQLVQDKEEARAVLVYLPIYHKGQPIDTLEWRRANLEGFVLTTLEVDDIVADAVRHLRPSDITIRIDDPSAEPAHTLLYASDSLSAAGNEDGQANRLRHQAAVNVADRIWEIDCVGGVDFAQAVNHTASWIILVCGVAFSVFVAVYLSDRNRAAQALMEINRTYSTLLGNLPGMAYKCLNDEDWTMQFVSDGCQALTGYRPNEFIDNRAVAYADIIHPDDRQLVSDRVAEAVARKTKFRIEYRIRTADGQQRWVWEQGQAIYAPNGQLLHLEGFITDVTEQKRSDRLERERNSFRENSRAMHDALGVIGHELRTPLAGLRAMAEYLLTDAAHNGGESQQFLNGIHDEVIRLADMVNTMLEGARLDSGRARWKWTSIDLSQVCQDAIDVILPLVDQQRVQLEAQVEPADLMMQGDTDAIHRLVLNLVTNAHKHTSAGTIRVTATAEDGEDGDDSQGREESWVTIRVADTGQGIPQQIVDKLGSAFALNSGTVGASYTKGAGLGLAICKGIVAAHGGTITVASNLGEGTVFTVRLRADLAEPAKQVKEMQIIQETAA